MNGRTMRSPAADDPSRSAHAAGSRSPRLRVRSADAAVPEQLVEDAVGELDERSVVERRGGRPGARPSRSAPRSSRSSAPPSESCWTGSTSGLPTRTGCGRTRGHSPAKTSISRSSSGNVPNCARPADSSPPMNSSESWASTRQSSAPQLKSRGQELVRSMLRDGWPTNGKAP